MLCFRDGRHLRSTLCCSAGSGRRPLPIAHFRSPTSNVDRHQHCLKIIKYFIQLVLVLLYSLRLMIDTSQLSREHTGILLIKVPGIRYCTVYGGVRRYVSYAAVMSISSPGKSTTLDTARQQTTQRANVNRRGHVPTSTALYGT